MMVTAQETLVDNCTTPVVELVDVAKKYRTFERPHHGLFSSLLGWQKHSRDFWALRGVNFCVRRGETVGIMGRNGAGKSTLLQMIAGTLSPSQGTVSVRGRVGALLELGAGFSPEFTGRENVRISASLWGLSKAEIDDKLERVIAFAEIGDFIDQPVKVYSSGMFVRLAFAVSTVVVPDLMIVDEALSVGDIRFQAKCFRRLHELQEQGTAILLVTHSPDQVIKHCSRAVLIENGSVIADGVPKEVSNIYMELMFGNQKTANSESEDQVKRNQRRPSNLPADGKFEERLGYNPNEYRWGDRRAQITDFQLLDADGNHTVQLSTEELYFLRVRVQFDEAVEKPVFGFYIKTIDGLQLTGANSRDFPGGGDIPQAAEAGEEMVATFVLKPRFKAGEYMISVGIAEDVGGELVPLDRRYDSILVHIVQTLPFFGLTYVGCECSVERRPALSLVET
jgi:lipopolysaccharide transport system ATP-binding protein